MTIDEFADLIAAKVLERLFSVASFPTAEDVERIRDHVSPNGVAYQNGRNHERRCIVEWMRRASADKVVLDFALYIETGEHVK